MLVVASSGGGSVNRLTTIIAMRHTMNKTGAIYRKCSEIVPVISFRTNRAAPAMRPTIIVAIAPEEFALRQNIPAMNMATTGGTAYERMRCRYLNKEPKFSICGAHNTARTMKANVAI